MNSIIIGALTADKKKGFYIRDFGNGIDGPPLESITKTPKYLIAQILVIRVMALG